MSLSSHPRLASCPAAISPLDLNSSLGWGRGRGPRTSPQPRFRSPRLQWDPRAGGAAGGAAATGRRPREGAGLRLHGGDLASHRRVRGWGGCSPPSPAVKPPLQRGEPSHQGRAAAGPQSLSDPTAEDPFRFRLVGFGFVSSSSEALLEPDSSSALGG